MLLNLVHALQESAKVRSLRVLFDGKNNNNLSNVYIFSIFLEDTVGVQLVTSMPKVFSIRSSPIE